MTARREPSAGSGDRARWATFGALVQELVEQVDDETRGPLKSVEILRRARLDGYEGAKSAIYELIDELRPHGITMMVRFQGCRASSPSTTSARCGSPTWTVVVRWSGSSARG